MAGSAPPGPQNTNLFVKPLPPGVTQTDQLREVFKQAGTLMSKVSRPHKTVFQVVW